MELKVLEDLSKEVPSAVSDIREALDLLSTSIDSAIDKVGEKLNISFSSKDFKKVSELNNNSEELYSVSRKIQEVIANIDAMIDERNIDSTLESVNERELPNYNDYLVDSEIEHNLYEDLTHKRPCALKIQGTKIDIKDWKGALVQTINYLAQIDVELLKSFVDDSKMNGKKVIYFSRVELPTMRAARKIDLADIYVETNLSANGIRNLIIKMLNKYNIKLSEYKIYLKADYSELH